MTAKPEAKAQVHVLEIAEISRIEPADLFESLPSVERRRGARRKDLDVGRGPIARGRSVTVPPGAAGDVITVAGAIEVVGSRREADLAGERRRSRVAFGRLNQ